MSRSRQPNGASSIFQGNDGRWHGYVTVGVEDNGAPDRHHVSCDTRTEATRNVRELERQRDSGMVRKAGQTWTVRSWLIHWWRTSRPRASPGRRFYKKMQDTGSSA